MRIMGLILAGGASMRMGRDKALLSPFAGAASMLESSFALLSGLVDVCMVSCRRGQKYDGFPCIEDGVGVAGPGRGIRAGLEKASSLGLDGVLALACDMPLMSAAVLENLLRAHENASPDHLATLYQSASSGRIEMLAAIYSVKFLPALSAGLARGEPSLYWLLPATKRNIIPYGEDMAALFVNCNTPADLELAGKGRLAR